MKEFLLPDRPAYMEYPGNLWDLSVEPNPALLHDYLEWLTVDDDRLASAAHAIQYYEVGFHGLTVGRQYDQDENLTKSLQLNFYHRDFESSEHPHGHSRDAEATLYSTGDRQQITRWKVLGQTAEDRINLQLADMPLLEKSGKTTLSLARCSAVANMIVDKRDGRRPDYHPLKVGNAVLSLLSISQVAPLGTTYFTSTEVHDVTFDFGSNDVAISAHIKYGEEPELLSTRNGLMGWKGLSFVEAGEVIRHRESLRQRLNDESSQNRLGPVTMMYPPLDFDVTSLGTEAQATDLYDAERLIIGGRDTLRTMVNYGSKSTNQQPRVRLH